ncbi:diaminohydroxyphosphoribosylaminopyrimidine deaminase/5-amino-6-(5-phosphoribosylamino)uracil reductase [Kineosphaera limosa NBRC 100340]|uniref:Riboflavin biosynthesis protein RibD n=2 Tax=Kineosphaera TaxID=211469 RepID=K6XCG7_9MICO|nr:diaminohydroxyphosphoribosylaminopyrimidine deaminase/5-amino-6-(5-phosphoribosylamino)uracil reductase [Kineosphaera limosa NBRC 100340]
MPRDLAPLMPAQAMDLAAELGANGPEADPNPRVGAVLLDAHGRFIGGGHHRGAGTSHAEIDALHRARSGDHETRGATAYITLEPCAHTGRTGPCADALFEAGVAHVVYAAPDPNPVAGGGARYLTQAGVLTELRHHDAAAALTRRWRRAMALGRPWVTWKTASTLDGRIAAADGTSRWITSALARADVHDLRSRCGAVITSTGTALADDPHFTVRDGGRPEGELADRQPLRVVLGERALPADAHLLDDAAPTLVLRSRDARAALARLHEEGVRRVLLECGPTMAAAFLRQGLVDEVVAYIAPALLGAGGSLIGDLGITAMDDVLRLHTRDVTRLGPDVRLTLEIPRRQ